MKTMKSSSESSFAAIRLTGLAAVLREEGFLPLDYRLLRNAAINTAIPAHQVNGVWHFYREDMEEIIRGLKLQRITKSSRQTAAA